MKNYFEIFEGKEEVLVSLGLEKEYEEVKKEWQSTLSFLKHKMTVAIMTGKIRKILTDVLGKIPTLKAKLLCEDNMARKSGHCFAKRNINKIIVLEKIEKEIKDDLKKTATPIESWILPADVRNIKEYGWDWFIRIFYKRILC